MKILSVVLLVCVWVVSCTTSRAPSTSPAASGSQPGDSYETAVVINEKSETAGVAAEYDWLRKQYPGYKSRGQALVHHNGKPYDIINITTAEGTEKEVYFDISNFFGKS